MRPFQAFYRFSLLTAAFVGAGGSQASEITFPVQNPPTNKYMAIDGDAIYHTVHYSNKVKLKVTSGEVFAVTDRDIIVARRPITVEIQPQPTSGWSADKDTWTETRDFRHQHTDQGQSNDPVGWLGTNYDMIIFKNDDNQDPPDEEPIYQIEKITPYVRVADLQVDSLNQNPYGGVSNSDQEDDKEDTDQGGKILGINATPYSQNSNKPGWADFSAAPSDYLSFAAMHLFLQSFPDGTEVRFQYSGSDPAAVNQDASGNWVLPPQGCLRVWTKNIYQARSFNNYVQPNVAHSFDQLANMQAKVADGHFVFYVEAVKGGTTLSDNQITVEVKTPGSGWVSLDTVRIIPLGLRQDNMPNVGIAENTTDMGNSYVAASINGGGIAYITGLPAMPQLKAEAKGAPANINIQWKLQIKSERSERGTKDDKNYPTSGYKTLSANQAWDIGAEFGPDFVGGKCKLFYRIGGGLEQTFEFFIRGKNPKDADAKSHIQGTSGTYLHAWAMVQHESRQGQRVYNQFNSGGSTKELPNFSGNYPAEDGWGMAQLDMPLGVSASTSEVYSWHQNISKFYAELAQKKNFATWYFNALKNVYQPQGKWEEPPANFVRQGTSTSMTAMEAAIIQLYNGAAWLVEISNGQILYDGPYTNTGHGGTRYISCWKFHPDNPSGQKWEFKPNQNNYVYKVIYDEFEAHETIQE